MNYSNQRSLLVCLLAVLFFQSVFADNTTNVSTTFNLEVLITDPDCAGETGSIEITNVIGGTPPYLFAINDENFSTTMKFDELLPEIYEVRAKDANDCEIILTFVISEPSPLLVVLAFPAEEPRVDPGETIDIFPNVSTLDELDYAWFVNGELFSNENTLSLQIQDSTTVIVEVFNANGCTAKDTLSIGVIPSEAFFVPNIFSPNGDGNNDTFTIFGKENRVNIIVSIEIFSRKGDVVFIQKAYPINRIEYGWDGTHRDKKLSPQVFAYVLEIELWNGEREIRRGTVALVR